MYACSLQVLNIFLCTGILSRETRRDYMLKFYIIACLCSESMQMCCVFVRLCCRIYSYVKPQYTKWDNINWSQWIKILTF